MASYKIMITGDKDSAFKMFNRIVKGTVPEVMPDEFKGVKTEAVNTDIDGENVLLVVTIYVNKEDQINFQSFDGVMVVYDISKEDSLYSVVSSNLWILEDFAERTVHILVGDKCEVTEIRPNAGFATWLVDGKGWTSLEVSSKENINVEKAIETIKKEIENKALRTTKVVALHDFDARYKDELSLKQNEICKLVSDSTEGEKWFKVKNKDGKIGLIPSVCVTHIGSKVTGEMVLRAFGNYTEPGEGYLSVNEGEIYTVLSTMHPWWRVKNKDGKTGYVPSNHVTVINDKTPTRLAFTQCSFQSEREEELSFDENELLTIIQENDNENWQTAKDKYGRRGLIPLNYVSYIKTPIILVIALFPFEENETEETGLPFKKGDILLIISQEGVNWWKAMNKDGLSGYIPSNHVTPIKDPSLNSTSATTDMSLMSSPTINEKQDPSLNSTSATDNMSLITPTITEKKEEEAGFLKRIFSIFKTTNDSVSAPEEILQDPFALNLYEKALKDGTEIDRSIRVNIVGNFGQGKTTLVKRLLYQRTSGVQSTNGIEVHQYTCSRSTAGKLSYRKKQGVTDDDIVNRLLNVKVKENEQPKTNPDNDLHIVKPIPTRTTVIKQMPQPLEEFDDTKRKQEASERCSIPKVPDLKTYAKADKPTPDRSFLKPVLSPQTKKYFEKQAQKKKKLESNKNEGTTFHLWDFGGQFIFYATHSLFHSRKAIYLLVFDLSLPLDQAVVEEDLLIQKVTRSVEYYLRFWMNSIHSFVGTDDGSEPVVILVGTHKDKIVGHPSMKPMYIQKYFSDVRGLFDDTKILNHIHKKDFAIDNKDSSDPNIAALRETILQIGEERSKSIAIPAKWIQLEKALNEIKDKKMVRFQTVIDIDGKSEFPLGDVEHIKVFLRYHHARGSLVYFDESPISEYVILEPRFLIDAFKSIITSEQFCCNDPVIRPHWKLLRTEARLNDSLIDYLWGRKKDKTFIDNKNILCGFLEKHRIITQARVFDETSQTSLGLGWYIVPSLLKGESFHPEANFLHGKHLITLQFIMEFQFSTIVELVFHRLLAAVVGKWPIVKYAGLKESHVLLYQKACVVHLQNHGGILELNSNCIRLSVASRCVSIPVQSKEADCFRRFCESVVQHEFSKLKTSDESQPKPYSVRFACNHIEHEGRGSKQFIPLDATKTVPCPDEMSHDISVETAKAEWYTVDKFADFDMNKDLNDKLCSRLSQCIGENWELLGIELGLSQVQIDHLTADNSSTKMRIYKMLLLLKSTTSVLTLQDLVQALKIQHTVRVDWDAVLNALEDIN